METIINEVFLKLIVVCFFSFENCLIVKNCKVSHNTLHVPVNIPNIKTNVCYVVFSFKPFLGIFGSVLGVTFNFSRHSQYFLLIFCSEFLIITLITFICLKNFWVFLVYLRVYYSNNTELFENFFDTVFMGFLFRDEAIAISKTQI